MDYKITTENKIIGSRDGFLEMISMDIETEKETVSESIRNRMSVQNFIINFIQQRQLQLFRCEKR